MIIHVHTWMRKIVMMQKLMKYTLDLLALCKKTEQYVAYYRQQIKSYNDTAHNILKNEIDLILPHLLTKKQKCGIITTLVSSFIVLVFHYKRYKVLQKAFRAMDSKLVIQYNKLMQLKKFHGHVWHLQCRNSRTTRKHSTLIFITLHLPMRDCLQDRKTHYHYNALYAQCIRHTLLHKLTTVSENCAR